MKHSVKPPEFKPVEVVLTLETLEDVTRLREALGNITGNNGFYEFFQALENLEGRK